MSNDSDPAARRLSKRKARLAIERIKENTVEGKAGILDRAPEDSKGKGEPQLSQLYPYCHDPFSRDIRIENNQTSLITLIIIIVDHGAL